MCRHAVWTAIALVFCLPRLGAADAPARLVVGQESIEELLDLPRDLPRGRYEVHCETLVGAHGNSLFAKCYSLTESAPRDLRLAVLAAIREARFVPAVRGGQAIAIHAVLMVVVDTRLAEPLILAVPNNGIEASRYGLLYTAHMRRMQFMPGYYEGKTVPMLHVEPWFWKK